MLLPEPYLVPAVEAISRQALNDRQRQYLEEARSLLLMQAYEPVAVGQPLQVDSEHYK